MTTYEDNWKRLAKLSDQFEPELRARFLAAVKGVKDKLSLDVIEQLIQEGRYENAVVIAETAAKGISGAMSAKWNELFFTAGSETAQFLEDTIAVVISFDATNFGAVQAMADNALDLVREIAMEQRATTQQAILDGVRAGLNPKQVAIQVRDSIGLTQRQQAAVANYRRLLETGSRDALDRALRDARFDPTVTSAANGTKALTSAQIDRMVSRYQERYLAYRAKVISRTEANRAANEGAHQMYVQAVDDGKINADDLTRKWVSTRDDRTRESHVAMQGQERGLTEPFTSGNGNQLLYPGDSSAPASDTVQCRCAVATRFSTPS